MIVHIPSPLRSYTNQARTVEVDGDTVQAVLSRMDTMYPGFRFRMIDEQENIRPHIKIFVDRKQISDLDTATQSADTMHIICALSGGLQG